LRPAARTPITARVRDRERAARGGRWGPLAAGLLAWLVLCAPVLAPGMQLGDRDTGRLYYPVKKFVAEGLRRGELRFWDPYVEGGVSLLGQVTPGLLHPLTLLYLLPFDLAFALNHLLALLLGGLGVYWLARELDASRWAALAGGFAFGGSGALVSAASSNLPYALGPATVPLAVAALFWCLRQLSPLRLLAASALLALCAYAGDPQSLGLAILTGSFWAVARERRRGLKAAAAWALCGLCLSAPVALPGFLQLRRSARVEGMTARETAAFSTLPVRLLGLLVPHAFDEQEPADGKRSDTFSEYFSRGSSAPFLGSILLGAPALLFAFAAGRRAILPLCAAAVFLLAATGEALGLQGALAAVIPGWRYFRFAEKLVLPASWLLAVAAALGTERALAAMEIRGGPRRLRRAALVLLGGALLGVAALMLWRVPLAGLLREVGRTHDPELPASLFGSLLRGLLETAALSSAVLLATRSRKLFVPVVLLCFAAPALLDPMLWPVDAQLFHGRSSTGELALRLAGPSEGRWRLWVDATGSLFTPGARSMEPHAARLLAGRETLFPQLQALDGIEGLAPYFSATDARFLAALRGAHEQLFPLFGVRVEVLQDRTPGPQLPQSDSGYFLREHPAQPRAFVVHAARALPRVDEAVAALRGLDVHQEALLERGAFAGPAGSASVRLERKNPQAMAAQVQTATEGLLIVGERFDPGWSARLDGAAAEVLETDLSVLGVRVPAGDHLVELVFFPRGLWAGLGFLLATAAVLFLLSRRKRGPPRVKA
jgi:hypothetical protein